MDRPQPAQWPAARTSGTLRAGVPRLWRLLGGLAVVSLAILAQHTLNQKAVAEAVLLWGAAIGFWMWLYGAPRLAARAWVDPSAPDWRWQWLGGSGLAMGFGLSVWLWRRIAVTAVTTADWRWYAGSVAVGLAAAAVMQPWRSVRRDAVSKSSLALWIIFLSAAAIRLWRLDSIPLGLWYDAAANGLEALRVLREPAYRPIYTDGVNATGHYLWLVAGAIDLLGVNSFALRLISALMGIGVVAAAYGAGREFYGHTVGLAAAMLMATAHWSVTFSRLGMYNTAAPLAALATLWFMVRGLRRNSPLDYGLAGLALGLGLCFYSAFQLFVAVLLFFLAGVLWQERRHWRRILPGLALSAAVMWLVIAPVAKFALLEPESYFARVQNTVLIRNLPAGDAISVLTQNAVKHLLMFNWHGDPNGRHNLPGAPLLDTISGGLLILGVALCIRRSAYLEFALLPVWLCVGLLGGILSLSFEAPQSLRSITAQPAVYFMIALPLGELAYEWVTGPGRDSPALAPWMIMIVLTPIAVMNTHLYFSRQTSDFATWNAHSTAETWAAEELRELNGAQAHVISLFDQHPTIRFLAPGVKYSRLETNATLPLLQPASQDVVLVLDIERRDLFEEARRLYPHARFEERRPPFGGPVVIFVARISKEDQVAVQGLVAIYRGDGGVVTRDEPLLDQGWPEDAPVDLPFSAEWEGVLAVTTYGPHQFVLQAPGEAALYIGEEQVLSGDAGGEAGISGAVLLAQGNHNLRVVAEGGEGRVALAWRTPERESELVPSWALYRSPVRSNGLLGMYYANGSWEDPATFAQIDPRIGIYFHVPVLPRPYTVEWTGKLAVPQTGEYGFGLESNDESQLMLDGRMIASSRGRGDVGSGRLMLNEGLHDIVVRYADRTDHTFINLSWLPPGHSAGDGYEIIPSNFLIPPQKDYTRIEMPALPMPTSDVGPVGLGDGGIDDVGLLGAARVETILDGLSAPRGIAAGKEDIFVAESGAAQVLVVHVESGETRALQPEGHAFVEPMDVATDAAGNVFVLDAGAARIDRFDASGAYIGEVPTETDLLNRARGISVDGAGWIWVAITAAQRMVAFDTSGEVVHEVLRPAVSASLQEMQPVDLVAPADGSIYATDAGNHRLFRFDLSGFVVSSMTLPVANSLDGSHLATDDAGNVYVTAPESGHVMRLDAQGGMSIVWSVRTAQTPDAKPVGIAVDAQKVIWLADVQGGRVLRVTPVEP